MDYIKQKRVTPPDGGVQLNVVATAAIKLSKVLCMLSHLLHGGLRAKVSRDSMERFYVFDPCVSC